MENITAKIKEYVLIINPTLTDDGFLDFCIGDVIDRALAYTNREQLVTQYEEDLDDSTVDEEDYVLPIPRELQRALARVVINIYATVRSQVANELAVTSLTDNGQSVHYSQQLASYMATSDDNNIFGGVKEILDKFRIPTIVDNSI